MHTILILCTNRSTLYMLRHQTQTWSIYTGVRILEVVHEQLTGGAGEVDLSDLELLLSSLFPIFSDQKLNYPKTQPLLGIIFNSLRPEY